MNWDEEYPCDNCIDADHCDHWDARYCCTLCMWGGLCDCENCDLMDI